MPAVLGANQYLGIDDLDTSLLYLLMAAGVGIAIALALFRGLGKMRESSKLQKSSWKTFDKVAKVRGLTTLEIQALRSVVRGARVKRPSQILGSMLLFDRCVDNALDRDIISEVEQGLLDGIRERLASASVPWDGHTNRREFERVGCDLDIRVRSITKESLDEELKSSYDEGDEKFDRAFEELAAQVPATNAHVQNLSAGGLSLLLRDRDDVHIKVGDYLKLESGSDPVPFDIDSLKGRVLAAERLRDEGQTNLHVGFLTYELELRRQIIRVVYESTESPTKKPDAKTQRRRKRKADGEPREKGEANTKPRRKKSRGRTQEIASPSSDTG